MQGIPVALALSLGVAAPGPRREAPEQARPPVAAPAPMRLLAPVPEAEPPPAGEVSALLVLAPVPEEEPAPAGEPGGPAGEAWEPAPAGQELVTLGPAPEEEPAPAGEDGEADPLLAEDPSDRRRRLRAEERHARREPGVCGEDGAPIAGFTVEGHRFTPRWLDLTLHGVIANRCQSKSYRDITPLDGGTVGISHFASGSLLTLYHFMDERRYFGAHAGRVPDRPYSLGWWRDGMRRFLRTPEARVAQQQAWRAYISPALASALRHGWRTDRELAIAASIANSLGAYGFQQHCQQNGWEPERAMRSYAGLSDHKERRRQRLDREFPLATPNS